MKRMALCCILAMFCLFPGNALWALDNDIKEIPSCKYCGMNRETFSHSRMLIDYSDNTKEGLCSLHCASVDLALNLDKAPKTIQVGDYGTKALINAETSFWVIGGSKPGVMTKRAKWAFEARPAAEAFAKENGGALAGFDEALKATFEDLYDDVKMIRDKRAAMRKKATEQKQ